jgi:hypothetical protein
MLTAETRLQLLQYLNLAGEHKRKKERPASDCLDASNRGNVAAIIKGRIAAHYGLTAVNRGQMAASRFGSVLLEA